MRTLLLLVATLSLLGGCSTRTPQQQAAYDDCKYKAEIATAGNPSPGQKGWNMGILIRECMKRKGL